MAWKSLALWADTPYPIMFVTTESMAPAVWPGDVLFIVNHNHDVQVGELPVCWFTERQFPMVHRVIQVMGLAQEEGRSTYVHSL